MAACTTARRRKPGAPRDLLAQFYRKLYGSDPGLEGTAEFMAGFMYTDAFDDPYDPLPVAAPRPGLHGDVFEDLLGRTDDGVASIGGSTNLPAPVTSYTHDAWGRLDVVEDNYSKYNFDYDNLDRVTSVDNNGNPLNVPRTVLTNEYDLLGRRTSLSAGDPAGLADFVNTYSYDAAGRMTSLTQAGQSGGRAVGEKRVDLAYDGLGRIDTITRYEDLLGTELVAQTAYDFDLAGRLTSLAHTAEATLLASYAYNYDRLGRLTKETSSADGVRNYRYDVLGQLTRVHGDATESYSHDATGNRTGEDKENGTNNRLLDDGTYTYQYDDNGNRIRRTEKATGDYIVYTWDHRNRRTSAEFHDASGALQQAVDYRYDVFDRLIGKLHDADGPPGFETEEYYVHDAAPGKGGLSDIVLEYNGNGAVAHRYLHGPGIDQLFSDESFVDGLLWSLADKQGTVRDWAEYDEVSDTTSVYNHVEFDSYGKVLSQSNLNHEFTVGYTGAYIDHVTGDQKHGVRWYNPETGRWLSVDPGGFTMGDVNLYRYVFNSPSNFTDPSGLQTAGDYEGTPWGEPIPKFAPGYGSPETTNLPRMPRGDKPSAALILIGDDDDNGYLNRAREMYPNAIQITCVADAAREIKNLYKANDEKPFSLLIIEHGYSGAFSLGDGVVTDNPDQHVKYDNDKMIDLLTDAMDGRVRQCILGTCGTGAGKVGHEFIQKLANESGAPFIHTGGQLCVNGERYKGLLDFTPEYYMKPKSGPWIFVMPEKWKHLETVP